MTTISNPETLHQSKDIGFTKFITWIFVLGYFVNVFIWSQSSVAGVPNLHAINTRMIELIITAPILAITLLTSFSTNPRAIRRFLLGFIALAGVAIVSYFLNQDIFNGYFEFGSATRYAETSLLWSVSFLSVVAYSVFWYSRELLLSTFWKVAQASMVFSLACFVASYLLSRAFFSHPSYGGGYRLQGILTEPSSWAPVVAVMIYMSFQRKAYGTLLLTIAVAVLSASGTVLVVMTLSIPIAHFLTSEKVDRRLAIIGLTGVFIAGSLSFLVTANPDAYLNSSNNLSRGIGKVIVATQSFTSADGTVSGRTASAHTTIVDMDASSKQWTGFGPGAVSVYFNAKYPSGPGQVPVHPNSFFLEILFDFGYPGLALLVALTLVSMWKMRVDRAATFFFVPFIIASLVNSASAYELYKWTALAVLLYGFGFVRRSKFAHFEVDDLSSSTAI